MSETTAVARSRKRGMLVASAVATRELAGSGTYAPWSAQASLSGGTIAGPMEIQVQVDLSVTPPGDGHDGLWFLAAEVTVHEHDQAQDLCWGTCSRAVKPSQPTV
ncbi:hypothetical protein [Cellulosimicrobium funkei]|uniref:hypothetical protein n=1 Tax=Cellulosimicrobium funkei TaxID=264251 RepID=UPI0037DD180C